MGMDKGAYKKGNALILQRFDRFGVDHLGSVIRHLDDQPEKLEHLAQAASKSFDVQMTKDLTLLTIRHYNTRLLQELCRDGDIILQQQTPETVQVLLRKK